MCSPPPGTNKDAFLSEAFQRPHLLQVFVYVGHCYPCAFKFYIQKRHSCFLVQLPSISMDTLCQHITDEDSPIL